MKARHWFGDLPVGWSAKRADAVLAVRKDQISIKSFASERVFHYSIPAIQEFGDGVEQDGSEIDSDKLLLQGNELLVSKLNPRKGTVLLAKPRKLPVVCSTEFVPLVPRVGFDARFAFYLYSSLPVRELISSTVQSVTRSHQRAGPEDISKIWLPVPPQELQHQIADYLDQETAQIDALITAKERVLSLLTEKRQALITHAVTRGLQPNVPLRESGMHWIGQIPTHWQLHRLKFHMPRIEQGWSPQCDNFPAEEAEWGVLKVGAVNGWEFNPLENKRLPLDLEPLTECEIRDGDILMSRANTTLLVGKAALVRSVRPRLMFCDKHYRLTIDHNTLDAEFLVLFLRSTAGHFEFERDATGAGNSMQNIGQDSVQNVWVTLPPKTEQTAVVKHLSTVMLRFDEMEAANRLTVNLLRERRSAVIAAAVTGQLKIEG